MLIPLHGLYDRRMWTGPECTKTSCRGPSQRVRAASYLPNISFQDEIRNGVARLSPVTQSVQTSLPKIDRGVILWRLSDSVRLRKLQCLLAPEDTYAIWLRFAGRQRRSYALALEIKNLAGRREQ